MIYIQSIARIAIDWLNVIDNKIIDQVSLFNYLGTMISYEKKTSTLTTNYITVWKLHVF